MDKIYSRPRIKIPKIKKNKPKKFQKIHNGITTILILIFIAIGSFLYAAYPVFVASCKTAASSKATHIVNEEVRNVMSHYNYHDFVDIEKDSNGEVVLMKYNTVLINQIMSHIASNIQNSIDQTPRIRVYINLGSVSGISMLSYIGPKFDIDLEAAGQMNTHLQSEFQSFNVNQTLHKIYLDLDMSIGILTPIGVYGKDITSKVLLTEAIIVGDVPDTYYNLEGIDQSNTLDLLE